MSDSEHVKIKRLIIETFNKWEHLTNEEWFAACALGHVSGDNLDDEIQSHIDRRMIAGAAEIKRLREERDEARRELCIGLADHTHCTFDLPDGCWNHLRVQHARGWDCFKEDRA